MKKYVAILLAVCLMTTLLGCQTAPDNIPDTTAPTTAPTTASPETPTETLPVAVPPTADQEPMISVSVPTVTETTSAQDGTVLFQYVYQTVSLTVPDPKVADKIIVELLNRIDETMDAAESILAMAQADYSAGSSWTPYLYRITYDPMRIDSGVLSLFGSAVSFSGTPHPEQTYPSVSFDMVTGEVLTLPGILAVDDTADALCQYVLDSLAEIKDEKYLREDYVSIVEDRFTGDLSGDTGWYFTPTGLCLYFIPYEIAPYSSGVVTAEVPYDLLPGVLADAYFPPERQDATGEVLAAPFDVDALDSFSQFPEVVLESSGEKILLYTRSAVYNLRLEVGSPAYSGGFAPDYTAFAAYSLTPGDALLVEADLPEDAPRLRLTYTSGEETVSLLLTKDADGAFVLEEE